MRTGANGQCLTWIYVKYKGPLKSQCIITMVPVFQIWRLIPSVENNRLNSRKKTTEHIATTKLKHHPCFKSDHYVEMILTCP